MQWMLILVYGLACNYYIFLSLMNGIVAVALRLL